MMYVNHTVGNTDDQAVIVISFPTLQVLTGVTHLSLRFALSPRPPAWSFYLEPTHNMGRQDGMRLLEAQQ